MVLVASLLTILAIVSAWVERQALDTNEWVDTSGRLLEDETIRNALATFAVDQLYANVNVNQELQQRLPKDLKPLSGPASSGLRALAQQGAQQALQSSRFQQLWEDANRAAHETLIKVVEDKGQYASTENGQVTLHLRPLIVNVANQLGLGGDVAGKIPPDVGNLQVLKSDQLGAAQTGVKLIRGLALVTSLLALLLYGLAIYLSRGYRWITVLASGIALIAAGVVVLIVRSVSGGIVVDQLATTQAARDPVAAAWPIATSLLDSIAKEVIEFGILFVIAAWLGSPHRSAVATRRALTPVLRDYPAIAFTVLGVAGLIFILSAADSTRSLLVHVGLVAFAVVGLVLLRRNSMREFPDAQMGDPMNRIRSRAAGMQDRRGRGGDQPPARSPEDLRLERLERLAGLHERGVLSDEEFEAEKTAVLSRQG
jgi:hypothetical protein